MQQTSLTLVPVTPNPQELKTQRDEMQGLCGGGSLPICPSSSTLGASLVPGASFLLPRCFSFAPICLHLSWRKQAISHRYWPSGCWGGVLTFWAEEPPPQAWNLTLLDGSCCGPSTLLPLRVKPNSTLRWLAHGCQGHPWNVTSSSVCGDGVGSLRARFRGSIREQPGSGRLNRAVSEGRG